MEQKILIVEDNVILSQLQKEWLERVEYEVVTAMDEPTTRTLVSSNIFWEEWGGKDNGGSGGEEGEDPSTGDGDVAPDPAL